MDLNRSIVHRILTSLEVAGLVQQDPDKKKWKLGIGFLTMGAKYLHQLRLPSLAQAQLLILAQETNETVHLCIRSELEAVIIGAFESRQSVRVSACVGDRAPLHVTASGKIFLAFDNPDLLKQVITAGLVSARSEAITVPDRLVNEVSNIKDLGFATDVEESEDNYSAYAAPVIAPDGTCVAAVAVALPIGRMRSAPADQFLTPLYTAVRNIGAEIVHGI
jgi:DNA-binding IclR family transcriptional regulator